MMDSWMYPKNLKRLEEPPIKPTLQDRLLAAFVAPFVFNFALLTVYAVIFRDLRGLVTFTYAALAAPLTISLIVVLVIGSAIAGFALGTRRFVTFFGHSFYTNSPNVRDWRITFAIWTVLFGLALLLLHSETA